MPVVVGPEIALTMCNDPTRRLCGDAQGAANTLIQAVKDPG
jgi:hypothetical protein